MRLYGVSTVFERIYDCSHLDGLYTMSASFLGLLSQDNEWPAVLEPKSRSCIHVGHKYIPRRLCKRPDVQPWYILEKAEDDN